MRGTSDRLIESYKSLNLIALGVRDKRNLLFNIICTVYYKTRKLTSGDAIATENNVAMNIYIHEAIVEKKQQNLLHQLTTEEGENSRSSSFAVFVHVEVLDLVG